MFLKFVNGLLSFRIEPRKADGGDTNGDKGGRGIMRMVTNGDKGKGGQNPCFCGDIIVERPLSYNGELANFSSFLVSTI